MKKVIDFVKKETVLSIALILAVVSSFFVRPDKYYIHYIDFRTLAILFSLMAVMAGLRKNEVFRRIAEKLLKKVKSIRMIIVILVMLCFFSSMIITNDVALITFVPLTIIVLDILGEKRKERWLLSVVAMQTVAANLGSMMTPIGNPQNLYLFSQAGISVTDFINLMLPYTVVSFFALLAWIFLVCNKNNEQLEVHFAKEHHVKNKKLLIIYAALFVICLMVVARVVMWDVMLVIVLITMLIMDAKVLKNVDYSLLLTFVGFFIFIGNMGRITAFSNFIESVIEGREVYTAVLSSQVMSNVPAALLLSGFTEEYKSLIIGTNLGGLGTLIASMASLISFKYIAKDKKENRLPYLVKFTISNILFLAILLVVYIIYK